MGILQSVPKAQEKTPVSNGNRRSMQADFAKLKPLNPNGLTGFSKFRDPNEADSNEDSGKKAGKKRHSIVDSDDEETDVKNQVLIKLESDDVDSNGVLSPEDAKRQGELAQGVQKIRVSNRNNSLNNGDTHDDLAQATTFDGSFRFAFSCTRPEKVSSFEHANSRLYTSIYSR